MPNGRNHGEPRLREYLNLPEKLRDHLNLPV
jgi:hypothetical protein